MLQGGYLLVQIFYVFVNEGVDPLAVLRGLFAEGQKLPNLGEIDAVQSAVADKAQLVQILACVDAVVAFAALRRFEQALLFVVPDRNDLAAGLLCEFTYLHGNAGANIPVFIETGIRSSFFKLIYFEIIILFREISMSISFFSSEKARLIETGCALIIFAMSF